MDYSVCFVVRLIGLEPTRRKTPDPKSGASTNFATGAFLHVLRNAVQRYKKNRKQKN